MKRFRRALVRCVVGCSMPLVLGAAGCVPGAHDAGGGNVDSPPFPNGTSGRPPTGVRPPAADPGPGPANMMPTVSAAVPPPALTGGTLLVLRDGNTAVAA